MDVEAHENISGFVGRAQLHGVQQFAFNDVSKYNN